MSLNTKQCKLTAYMYMLLSCICIVLCAFLYSWALPGVRMDPLSGTTFIYLISILFVGLMALYQAILAFCFWRTPCIDFQEIGKERCTVRLVSGRNLKFYPNTVRLIRKLSRVDVLSSNAPIDLVLVMNSKSVVLVTMDVWKILSGSCMASKQ